MINNDPLSHWLDAAAMLAKAGRDIKRAHEHATTSVTADSFNDDTQRFLKSALHNITAAIARFEADIVR